MNDIEEDLTATLARRAATVPNPIGLTEEIRRRHGEQRRRRTLVTAVSGIAAATLVAGGVTLVDLPSSGGDAARTASAAGPSPSDPVKTDPAPTKPTADPSPSGPVGTDPMAAVSWPARGVITDEQSKTPPLVDEYRRIWAEAPGSNVQRGDDVAPLKGSARLISVLYAPEKQKGNVLVLQGTDETNEVMVAFYEMKGGDVLKVKSRDAMSKYKVPWSRDVLRAQYDDRVLVLTPPDATASVSRTPAGEGKSPAFTPIPLKDGLLDLPLVVPPAGAHKRMPPSGSEWRQLRVLVGSEVVYQGPLLLSDPDPRDEIPDELLQPQDT